MATTQQPHRWHELFTAADGRNLSIAIEGLYLVNLLALPAIAFAVLVWLWLRRETLPALARCHLRQTMSASLWAFGMLIGFNGLVIWWFGAEVPATWVFVLLYFLTVHSALVMFGMLGLARAMAGDVYRFPVVGLDCEGMATHGRR
ncbi:MAG: hypothetical protein R3298_11300 [Gammaproteobacteria bacterium]|nr:hypothetical protein [Gammaproteobacteria bacterium]